MRSESSIFRWESCLLQLFFHTLLKSQEITTIFLQPYPDNPRPPHIRKCPHPGNTQRKSWYTINYRIQSLLYLRNPLIFYLAKILQGQALPLSNSNNYRFLQQPPDHIQGSF